MSKSNKIKAIAFIATLLLMGEAVMLAIQFSGKALTFGRGELTFGVSFNHLMVIIILSILATMILEKAKSNKSEVTKTRIQNLERRFREIIEVEQNVKKDIEAIIHSIDEIID